jgi:hypothetical protein
MIRASTSATAIETSAMSLIVGVTLIPVVAVVVVGRGLRLGYFGHLVSPWVGCRRERLTDPGRETSSCSTVILCIAVAVV